MMGSTLVATAYHEAGHAVVAVYLMVRIRHVTIKARKDTAGHVALLRPARGMKETHARGIIALAGEAAQRRFNPRSVRRHHGEGDRKAVDRYAKEYSGGSARYNKALVDLWQIRADDLVKLCWPTIVRVAEALLERRTLPYSEVCALMHGTEPTKPLRHPDTIQSPPARGAQA